MAAALLRARPVRRHIRAVLRAVARVRAAGRTAGCSIPRGFRPRPRTSSRRPSVRRPGSARTSTPSAAHRVIVRLCTGGSGGTAWRSLVGWRYSDASDALDAPRQRFSLTSTRNPAAVQSARAAIAGHHRCSVWANSRPFPLRSYLAEAIPSTLIGMGSPAGYPGATTAMAALGGKASPATSSPSSSARSRTRWELCPSRDRFVKSPVPTSPIWSPTCEDWVPRPFFPTCRVEGNSSNGCSVRNATHR